MKAWLRRPTDTGARLPSLAFLSRCALAGLGLLTGCSADFTAADVAYFQPPITASSAPARPLRESWSLHNNTRRVGLAEMRPIIPAFNGQGALLASWNPHPAGVFGRPSFIVIHGGHGLNPTNFATALWLRDEFQANVLVLDSYWSRGRAGPYCAVSRPKLFFSVNYLACCGQASRFIRIVRPMAQRNIRALAPMPARS